MSKDRSGREIDYIARGIALSLVLTVNKISFRKCVRVDLWYIYMKGELLLW